MSSTCSGSGIAWAIARARANSVVVVRERPGRGEPREEPRRPSNSGADRVARSRHGTGRPSPAAGLAHDAVQDRGPPRAGGSRPSSGRRRSAPARRPASPRRGPRSPGWGACPRATASVARARIGVAATEPSATRTSRHGPRDSARRRAPRDGQHDLADRLRPTRADLAEAHLAIRRRAGSGCAAPARRGRGRSADTRSRSRRRGPRARRAPIRARTRRRPRAGPAACRRPARRWRCCRRACRGSGSGPRRSSRPPRRAPGRARGTTAIGGSPCTSSGRRATSAPPSMPMPRSASIAHRSTQARRRLAELAGQRDHQVRAAGDRPGGRVRLERRRGRRRPPRGRAGW